jgi:hypothetical protein
LLMKDVKKLSEKTNNKEKNIIWKIWTKKDI